jgi:hypothetical protein
MAVKKPAKKRAAAKKPAAVSGMPDGSGVAAPKGPNTKDDMAEAYAFVKNQKRRTPPK